MEKPSDNFSHLVAAAAADIPKVTGHQIMQRATLELIDLTWEQYQLERAELNRQLDDLRQQVSVFRTLVTGMDWSKDGKAE